MRRALIILAVMTVGVLSLTSVASAAVSPTGTKTAVASTSVTFSGTGVTCTTATFSGTWSSPAVPPYVISTDMWPVNTGCRGVGGLSVFLDCTRTAVLTVTGSTVANITPMTLTGISCRLAINSTCNATLSGAVNAPYENIPVAMTISTTGQTLAVSGTRCATIFPNGSTTLTGAGGVAARYYVSPATSVIF
jgi:hypothetical protein